MALHGAWAGPAAKLSRDFAAAQPFRYLVMDDFLPPALCDALMAEFPSFDPRAACNELGGVGGKAVVSNVRSLGPIYRQFDDLMRSREFLGWLGQVTGIPNLLYDPDYVGGGTHENRDGQELDMHVDFNYHPSRRLHRRLNLIVFLNPQWEESWGGCLELRKDPWTEEEAGAVKVLPLRNRAALFETTESSWHGFSQIRLPPSKEQLSRKSIAVYFYTKERPAEQTAASHGTVYIPRALSSRFAAGYTLTAEDQSQLETLISRRDAQIRFLYEREKEIMSVLDGTLRSPSFRLGRTLTWPLRKIMGRD